jgi:hypothetical protein
MRPLPHTLRLPTAALAATLAAGALGAAPAAADSVIDGDPSVMNVSAYGTTSAWSRKASDGRYRLVVMGASRVPVDAQVRSSPIPFDPDVGPTTRGTRMVVYSRCKLPAFSRLCDVYGYDVHTRIERKLTSISAQPTSETAPSYFKGTVAFARDGKRAGLYVAKPGQAPKRISSAKPHETDLSKTHVAFNAGDVVVAKLDGTGRRFLGDNYGGEEAFSATYSPVLSRSRVFWISGGGEYGQHMYGEPWLVSVGSLSLTAGSTRIWGDRALPVDEARTIALGPSGRPELYSGDSGISLVNPFLSFAP